MKPETENGVVGRRSSVVGHAENKRELRPRDGRDARPHTSTAGEGAHRYRSRRTFSLAFLLTTWYSAVAFLLVAVAAGLMYLAIANDLRRFSEQLLVDELDVCRALVRDRSVDPRALREEVEVDSAERKFRKFYVRVLDQQGRSLFVTPGMNADLPAMDLARADAARPGSVFWIRARSGVPYRAIISSVQGSGQAHETWTLQVAVDLTQELQLLGQQRVWLWTVLAAALVLCPGIGFLIARRGAKPLREVAATARIVGSHTLNERIQTEGYPSELASLAATFNDMLERLEDSFTRLSRFSADIAHELRTPVNNIRGQAEVALQRTRSAEEYRDVLGSCLEETVRLTDLIESLLFLARSDSPGEHLKLASVDVAALLSDVRDYYEALAAEVSVTLTSDAEPGLLAQADRALLHRALGNLVSNALAHSSAGQSVTLAAARDDTRIRIEVRDSGSGIPPEALPKIFDRFYRADPSRTRNQLGGSGLGLAIVRQIVHLHHGEVQIASEVGRGTVVRLWLPQSG